MRTENVIEESSPERFYEIGGRRVYLMVDDKPVEEYFRHQSEQE